jgi:hypothetical protein
MTTQVEILIDLEASRALETLRLETAQQVRMSQTLSLREFWPVT